MLGRRCSDTLWQSRRRAACETQLIPVWELSTPDSVQWLRFRRLSDLYSKESAYPNVFLYLVLRRSSWLFFSSVVCGLRNQFSRSKSARYIFLECQRKREEEIKQKTDSMYTFGHGRNFNFIDFPVRYEQCSCKVQCLLVLLKPDQTEIAQWVSQLQKCLQKKTSYIQSNSRAGRQDFCFNTCRSKLKWQNGFYLMFASVIS